MDSFIFLVSVLILATSILYGRSEIWRMIITCKNESGKLTVYMYIFDDLFCDRVVLCVLWALVMYVPCFSFWYIVWSACFQVGWLCVCVLQFKEADMSQLMDSKLRCVFELPMDSAAQAPQNNIDASPSPHPHLEASKPSPKVSHRNTVHECLYPILYNEVEIFWFLECLCMNIRQSQA